MRMAYSHIFEIRLKSIRFDEKMINIVYSNNILFAYYSHISRFCFIHILFAYFACLFEAFKCCLVTIERKSVIYWYLKQFDKIFSKNSEFSKLTPISRINNGLQEVTPDFDHSPANISKFSYKFCPITNCDVESGFSKYNPMLTDSRHNLKFKNLKRMFILLCNSKHEFVTDIELD